MTQLRNFVIGNTTAEESLFFYEGGVNHSSFINRSFEPLFEPPPADENVTRMCGGSAQCVFDYTVTGKKSLALASAVAAKQHQMLVEGLNTGKSESGIWCPPTVERLDFVIAHAISHMLVTS